MAGLRYSRVPRTVFYFVQSTDGNGFSGMSRDCQTANPSRARSNPAAPLIFNPTGLRASENPTAYRSLIISYCRFLPFFLEKRRSVF